MAQITGAALIVTILMLAIISRKNYSKYKDSRDPLWWVAGWMTDRLSPKVRSRVKSYIRRTVVLNEKPLEQQTDRWIATLFHKAIIGVVILAFIIIISGFIPEKKNDPYVIDRPGVAETSKYVDVKLSDSGDAEGEIYQLEIHSREYTTKEFNDLAAKAKLYIGANLIGENADADHVMANLFFPTKDESGTLKIIWDTDDPVVVDYEGTVNNDDLKEEGKKVNISARITDGNHSDTYQTAVTVVGDEELVGTEWAKLKMLEIEEENRSEEKLQIPKQIGEISVKRETENQDDQLMRLLAFGIVMIVIWGYYRVSKLREEGRSREKELEMEYFGFVNRLTIYIGAGFSLRRAMEAAAKQGNANILADEVDFSIKRIESGVSEGSEYMELGKRLVSSQYTRLMSLISQNLAYGNSNLLRLLDMEVKNGFYMRREMIRKKGEQASEKLLIPTAILLGLVMLIVVYPALTGI